MSLLAYLAFKLKTPETYRFQRLFEEAGERTRTVDIQLGKLTFYH
jgi:hypothetical protein